MKPRSPRDRLIVALDVRSLNEALGMVSTLKGQVNFFKVGLGLFSRVGPEGFRKLKEGGARLFLDLKFHDIPAVVREAAAGAASLGADLITVHASGGADMMAAAAEGVRSYGQEYGVSPPAVLGVTVLTSLDKSDLEAALGYTGEVDERVKTLALLAQRAGLDGLVASAREASMLREAVGPGFLIITPGIRPAEEGLGDQKRVTTPAEAIRGGSDYLVVGRPVTRAEDPAAAAEAIIDEIKTALTPG